MHSSLERKPNIILSAHLKGGCGKTTVLTDLGILMALNGQKVVAIDTDMQGAMISTLTGLPAQRYSPSERAKYLMDFKSAAGLKRPQTGYPEVNANLTAIHYPLEMFYPDSFSHPEFGDEFANIVEGALKGTEAILVDMPPVRLVSDEIKLFQTMAPFVGDYTFLIVNRPTPKEIEDGATCFKYIQELMIRGGIDAQRIRSLLVLNFVQVLGSGNDFVLSGRGGTFSLEEGDRHVVASSPFITPPQKEIGVPIPSVQLPNVARTGKNLHHYSILLDNIDLRELLNTVKYGEEDANDRLIRLGAEGILSRRPTEDYLAYLEGIWEINRMLTMSNPGVGRAC